MNKILFAIGTLVLGLTAAAPAHADYAIVKFNSGYCRIYDNTALAPPDGTFVWFVWGHHRYYRLPTLPIAQHKLAESEMRGITDVTPGAVPASCTSMYLALIKENSSVKVVALPRNQQQSR